MTFTDGPVTYTLDVSQRRVVRFLWLKKRGVKGRIMEGKWNDIKQQSATLLAKQTLYSWTGLQLCKDQFIASIWVIIDNMSAVNRATIHQNVTAICSSVSPPFLISGPATTCGQTTCISPPQGSILLWEGPFAQSLSLRCPEWRTPPWVRRVRIK